MKGLPREASHYPKLWELDSAQRDRCAYCGGSAAAPWRVGGYCLSCTAAHAEGGCEARPGACEICDAAGVPA